MGQYEQIQTRKIISAYGGVGSIIETRDGAILIEEFNKWPYFQNEEDFEECNYAEDKRFLNRLKIYFKDLENLIKVPTNEFQKGKLKDKLALISAKYFPEWFYCHNCHRFDKLENWKTPKDEYCLELRVLDTIFPFVSISCKGTEPLSFKDFTHFVTDGLCSFKYNSWSNSLTPSELYTGKETLSFVPL